MRLQRLLVHGLTRFSSPVEIDFASLPDGVIAVAGPNGVGKSSLTDACGPGALFRELCRDPPAIKEWLNPAVSQAILELDFSANGRQYKIRHLIGKGASSSLHEDGVPLSSGKVRDFDRAIRRLFGRKDAFFASYYAGQGGEGRFGNLSVSNRKALFRYYLGMDRLSAVAKAASVLRDKIQDDEAIVLASQIEIAQRRRDEALRAGGEALRQQARAKKEADETQAQAEQTAYDASLLASKSAFDAALTAVVQAERRLALLEAALDPDVEANKEAVAEAEDAWQEAVRQQQQVQSLKRDHQEAQRRAERANQDLLTAEGQANVVDVVPCRGMAKFAGCHLLRDAYKASESIPELRQRYEDLLDAQHRAEGEYANKALDQRSLNEAEKALQAAREAGEAVTQAREAAVRVEAAKEALVASKDTALRLRKSLPNPMPQHWPDPGQIQVARQKARDARQKAEDASGVVAQARAEVGVAEGILAGLKARLDDAKGNLRKASALELLTRAFGPSGIQALEIDGAAPFISGLANDLLQSCFGDRFSVSIATTKPNKSNPGVQEDFEVLVTDSERGRGGTMSSLSGGEAVILDESLRTSLALFAAQQGVAELNVDTMFRDELPAMLYEDAPLRYMAMLQRARVLGNFAQVIVVTDAQTAEGATAVLRVNEDGTVTRAR